MNKLYFLPDLDKHPRVRLALVLTLILLVSLWFRIPSISHGMPFFYLEDEAHHHNRVVDMVKSGDLNPHYFHKPSLHFYLRMPVVGAGFLWTVKKGQIKKVNEIKTHDPYGIGTYAFTASHPGIVKWNRAFSVLLFLGATALCFVISILLTKSLLAGSVSALVMAFSPELTLYASHIGVDIPMLFFCLLASFLSLRTFNCYSLAGLFCTGVVAGLAVSCKYNALPIAIIPALLCILSRKFSILNIILAIISPPLGFILGSPYTIQEFPLFLNQFAYEIWHYGVEGHIGHTGKPGLSQAYFYTNWITTKATGWITLILAMLGSIQGLRKDFKKTLLFFSFPALFFFLMCSQKANFTRNMLVIIPYIAILASLGGLFIFDIFKKKLEWEKATACIILVALISEPLFQSLSTRTQLLLKKDSRQLAYNWINTNTPKLLETALSGELQLPPFIYTNNGRTRLSVKGLTRFNPEKQNITSLYLSGFDRIIAGPRTKIQKEELKHLEEIKTFSGTKEEQRIIDNPHISVYKFKESNILTTYLLKSERTKETKTKLKLEIDENKSSISLISTCESKVHEKQCWLNKRINRVKINKEDVTRSLKSLSVEVMSTWPEQVVSFSIDNIWNSKEFKFSTNELGLWKKITLDLPTAMINNNTILNVMISEIHSPKTQEISKDDRRLGLAVK